YALKNVEGMDNDELDQK
ncbi:unnamed protein product, partial [Didymodactylos carnosus]